MGEVLENKDATLQELFEESRKHYAQMLENASPFPSNVLTVDRVNQLHARNLELTNFINSLYARMTEDVSRSEMSNDAYVYINEYLARITSFAKTKS